MRFLFYIFILFQCAFSDMKTYKHNQVYIVNDDYYMNLKKNNECGSNLQICKTYFSNVINLIDDVKNGFLKKEKIYISSLPILDKNISSPYKYIINKNGYKYYLPKYIYNPNLMQNDNLKSKHQISIGDMLIVYFLFDKVLFAELITE